MIGISNELLFILRRRENFSTENKNKNGINRLNINLNLSLCSQMN